MNKKVLNKVAKKQKNLKINSIYLLGHSLEIIREKEAPDKTKFHRFLLLNRTVILINNTRTRNN